MLHSLLRNNRSILVTGSIALPQVIIESISTSKIFVQNSSVGAYGIRPQMPYALKAMCSNLFATTGIKKYAN
jgi:hypothetical protein